MTFRCSKAMAGGMALILALALVLLVLPALAQKGDTQTRTLNGQVLDKASNPLEKAVVHLKNTKSLQIRTYITDQGGNFHFQALSVNVDYEVHAEYEGASSAVKTISSFDNRKQVTISLKIDKK